MPTVGQPDPLEQLERPPARRRPADATAPWTEGHVVEHAQVREKQVVLGHQRHVARSGSDEHVRHAGSSTVLARRCEMTGVEGLEAGHGP